MPIYEYTCRSCGADFEEFVRTINEEQEQAVCPECGARRAEKRHSVFAAHEGTAQRRLPMGGCGRCGDPNGPCGLD